MLSCIDARIQLLENLIVATKQRSIEHFRISHVDRRLERLGGNNDALRLSRESFKLEIRFPCLTYWNADFPGNGCKARSFRAQRVITERDIVKGELTAGRLISPEELQPRPSPDEPRRPRLTRLEDR
jgi:hypothetical protein